MAEKKKGHKYKAHKKYNKETQAKEYYKKKAKSRPLETVGKVIGSYFGEKGSKVGKFLGRAAGIITGSGSYQIHKNSLMADQVPFVHSTNEIVRIKHREFLGNLNGSVNFVNTVYNINPGLAGPFPWLYSTALSFEQYKINGMIVEFVSTACDALASNNNAMGTITLATDYNVVNDDFTTMSQCQNSMWSATGKPSKNIVMPIECDGKLNVLDRLFIRSDTTSLTNSDLRLYDHCKINIATEGQQIATQIGQLWLSYDISFYKPVLTNSLGQKTAHYYLGTYIDGFFSTKTEKTNSLGIYFNPAVSNQRVYFPKSCVGKTLMFYLVQYVSVNQYNWTEYNYSLSGLSAVNVINNGTANQLDVPFSPMTISNITCGPSLIVCFKVDSADSYIQISGGVNNGGTNKGELFIWQYN